MFETAIPRAFNGESQLNSLSSLKVVCNPNCGGRFQTDPAFFIFYMVEEVVRDKGQQKHSKC